MRKTHAIVLLVLLLALPAWSEGLAQGAMLPDFDEMTVGGHPVSGQSLRGRPLIVWFSRFSDGEVAAATDLLGACKKHADRGLTVLVMSLNGPYDARAKKFAARFDMLEQVAVDSDGSTVRKFTGRFAEGVMPSNNVFTFNAEGKLTGIYHYPGMPPNVLDAELRRLWP